MRCLGLLGVLEALSARAGAAEWRSEAPSEEPAEWSYENQGSDWDHLCRGSEQSPIDIEPSKVEDSDLQVRVLYNPWRGEDIVAKALEKSLDGNDVPSFAFGPGSSPGKVQVGTDYSDFDEYALTSVEVHSPSEHTFRQASWPLELQLWHEPMPLKRISGLAQRVSELEERNRRVNDQLDLLEEIQEQLEGEYRGYGPHADPSPRVRYQQAGGDMEWLGRQTLGLIEATKDRIEDETLELRQGTKANHESATALAQEAGQIATAEGRPLASHRLVISLFVRRGSSELLDDGNHSAAWAEQLIDWVSKAMTLGGGTPGELDAAALIFEGPSAQDRFYGYMGSLTRPPCTPHVRWFVTAKPIAVSVEALERLLRATRLGGGVRGAASDGVVGDAREVQAVGSDRSVWRVAVSDAVFEEPVLGPASVGGSAQEQGEEKWAVVQRYSKVFFMCSSFLLISPFMFYVHTRWQRCLEARQAGDLQESLDAAAGGVGREDEARGRGDNTNLLTGDEAYGAAPEGAQGM